jgi:hypothetical protein
MPDRYSSGYIVQRSFGLLDGNQTISFSSNLFDVF